MKIYWSVFLVLLSFPVFSQQKLDSLFEVKKDLDHPFFHHPEWSYPWYTIKHDDGSFESTMSDSTGKEMLDTTHIPHQAKCVTNNQYEHEIRFCTARLQHDTLVIELEDFSASTNDHLQIKIIGQKQWGQYSTSYVFRYKKEDVSWVTTHQKLLLNTNTFTKGTPLKGLLDFTCVEQWAGHGDILDKWINIKGPFQCVIE